MTTNTSIATPYNAITFNNNRVVGYSKGSQARATHMDASRCVFSGPHDLARELNLTDLNHMRADLLHISGESAPSKKLNDHHALADEIWLMMVKLAEPSVYDKGLVPRKKAAGGKARRQGKTATRRYALTDKGKDSTTWDLFPEQAQVILLGLKRFEDLELTELQMRELVDTLVREGLLQTRQDPWRIFQYYRPQMIGAGLLRQFNGEK